MSKRIFKNSIDIVGSAFLKWAVEYLEGRSLVLAAQLLWQLAQFVSG